MENVKNEGFTKKELLTIVAHVALAVFLYHGSIGVIILAALAGAIAGALITAAVGTYKEGKKDSAAFGLVLWGAVMFFLTIPIWPMWFFDLMATSLF